MIFIYMYCLSCMELKELLPEENSIIVNLHNWNGYIFYEIILLVEYKKMW